jgi:PAS domain S-box-containing protein
MGEARPEQGDLAKDPGETTTDGLSQVRLAADAVTNPASERQQTERALGEQEDLYSQLTENLQEVLWIGSPDWQRVWYVNRAYERLWDRSCQSLYDRPMSWLDAVVEEDRPRVLAEVIQKVASGAAKPGFVEYRIKRRDGSIRWIMARAFPVSDEHGKLCRVAGLAADITSQKLAEQELRASEDRFHSLLENAPVGILLADPEGRCLLVNRRWSEVSGLSSQEASGRGWLRALHRDERRDFFRKWRQAVRAGRELCLDLQLRSPAGRVSWQAASIKALCDETGKTTGILAAVTDITLRRSVEQRLKQSEIDYRTLAENLTGIVYRVFLREGNRMRFFNTALESLTGFRPEELVRGDLCSIDPLILEQDRGTVVQTVRNAVSRRESFEVAYRLRRRDGEIRHFFERGKPIYGEDGAPLFIDGVIFDVTVRRQAEEALVASEQRLAMAQSAGHVGVFDWDLGTGRVVWNEQMEKIFGLRPGTFEGDYESWIRRVPPEEREEIESFLSQSFDGRRPHMEFEYRLLRPDGEARCLVATVEVSYREDGAPLRMIGTNVDITERKEAEEALRHSREILELRVQERTEALNRTVEDLRDEVERRINIEKLLRATNLELERRAEQLSQLTAELILAEQRERHRLSQVLHDHLQQLLVGAKFGLNSLTRHAGGQHLQNIRHLEKLIDESLEVSRSLTVELHPPILHEAGLGAGLEWLASWMREKHGLLVTLNLDSRTSLPGDDIRILLFQAVRELLLNVVKHSHVLRAHIDMAPCDDLYIRVAVSDDGQGFDPVATQIQANQGAGGFGLYSIRERLALLGGRLEVDSAPGKGARFVLIAPLHATGSTPSGSARRDASHPEAQVVPCDYRSSAKKIRVLLADDHVVVREGLLRLLSGYHDIEVVGEAGDGKEAVERATQLSPDVILMDLDMPMMNGIEATRIIREKFPGIRVIGLSMYEEEARARAMLEAGAVTYLTKTGHPAELVAAIESCVR